MTLSNLALATFEGPLPIASIIVSSLLFYGIAVECSPLSRAISAFALIFYLPHVGVALLHAFQSSDSLFLIRTLIWLPLFVSSLLLLLGKLKMSYVFLLTAVGGAVCLFTHPLIIGSGELPSGVLLPAIAVAIAYSSGRTPAGLIVFAAVLILQIIRIAVVASTMFFGLLHTEHLDGMVLLIVFTTVVLAVPFVGHTLNKIKHHA